MDQLIDLQMSVRQMNGLMEGRTDEGLRQKGGLVF